MVERTNRFGNKPRLVIEVTQTLECKKGVQPVEYIRYHEELLVITVGDGLASKHQGVIPVVTQQTSSRTKGHRVKYVTIDSPEVVRDKVLTDFHFQPQTTIFVEYSAATDDNSLDIRDDVVVFIKTRSGFKMGLGGDLANRYFPIQSQVPAELWANIQQTLFQYRRKYFTYDQVKKWILSYAPQDSASFSLAQRVANYFTSIHNEPEITIIERAFRDSGDPGWEFVILLKKLKWVQFPTRATPESPTVMMYMMFNGDDIVIRTLEDLIEARFE